MSTICGRCNRTFNDDVPVRNVECYGEDAYYACPYCGKLHRYHMVVYPNPTLSDLGKTEDDWGNKVYTDKEYIKNEFRIKLEDGEIYYVSTNNNEFNWIVTYKDNKSEYCMAYYFSMSLDDEVIEFSNTLCNYTDISSIRKASDEEIKKYMSVLNNVYNLKWSKKSKELKGL